MTMACRACFAVLVGVGALAGGAFGRGERPDAAMLMYPDVSAERIVFVYQNDVWTAPRTGGEARPLAAPDGREMFPRFSPDGSKIAFMGNYEGDKDLYVIPSVGGVAHRVTHHPTTELLCDWAPGGELLFYASGFSGLTRQTALLTVDAEGGLPKLLPPPYGAAGAISADGEWLAYTPHNRDFRTWKRYRGGRASDIWLFNLRTNESEKITDWEGTDTQPMWHAGDVYYLSDAGPAHRLNIWKYDVERAERTQLTSFTDYDVKWPSVGPGPRGGGEIIFQAGRDLRLLDLSTGRQRVVEVTVPGDRAKVRPRDVDFGEFISGGSISPTGARAAMEARGDIWSLPGEQGISRNLTGTSDAAERDPAWSPDGKWIAYASDETGEYEIYVTQSDGKGETQRLTTDGATFRYLGAWSPDSSKLVNYDKTGRMFLLDIESRENEPIATDQYAQRPPVSWSHDARWMAFTATQDNRHRAIVLYDVETGERHTVTEGFFDASWPTFDRKGSFLYYVSSEHFSPDYSGIDTSFIYDDPDRLLAVPLRADVENPFLPEIDVESWDDDDEDADAEGDDAEADDDDADGDRHPLHGVWKGVATGPEPMVPGGEIDIVFTFVVDEDGAVAGASEVMGEESAYDSVEFDEGSGKLTATRTEGGVTSVVEGVLSGEVIEGTWKVEALGVEGTFRVELTDEAPDADAVAGGDDAVEVVEIDVEGFERRAVRLPIDNGRFSQLAVSHDGKLFYLRSGDPAPSVKMFDIDDHEEGERQVLGGVGQMQMSADGKKLGVAGPQGFAIVKASGGQSWSKPVPTDAMTYRVEPRDEWAQMLRDAWRIHRDFFYEPTMHGVDWPAVYDRYASMLPHASSREDLTYLIGEMISELNVGHAYVRGLGDVEEEPSRNVGLLGVDFELGGDGQHEAYRIAAIHEGAAWDADARNPLRAPGVEVEVGDYLLAVNGAPVHTDRDPWAAFQGLAGRVTELTVSKTPSRDDEARDVLVTPLSSDAGLRYRGWIEANRQRVDYATGGKVGYLYVPNTGVAGQNDLFRQFYGQRHKDGLIIDERWNGGGQIPTRFIELLNRPRTNYWRVRDGKDWAWPPDSHQGPKAMLINGAAGSGGDMFPHLFREAGLGPLIGWRTWGGLVGISGNPALIDGGYTSAPTFGFYETDGTWGIEGHGVDPDIEVLDDPSLMVDGGDPQLDAAIDWIMAEIRRNPYTPPARPASPDRSGMGIEDEDK